MNARNKIDAATLMAALPDASAALVILDPQYRAVLDAMQFGNEGARQQARAALPQMDDAKIAGIVEECARVLRAGGHLALWVDKYMIGEAHHHRYFRRVPRLRRVDLLCWGTLRFGMGKRTRRACEYLVIAQKEPLSGWRDHGIRDFWPEAAERDNHAHAKPYQLTERLVQALTRRGELVVDPCAGSFMTLDVCQATGRDFLGGDVVI